MKYDAVAVTKYTFMRAFESSPVHCLKPRPSGNRRRPENGGVIAMLIKLIRNYSARNQTFSPVIDIIQDPISPRSAMFTDQVVFHPSNKMIFKYPFDDLMEEIRR